MAQRLGWDGQPGEEHLTKLLRNLLLGRLAMLDDEQVLAEAEKRFLLHVQGVELIAADLRSTVYRAVLRSGKREHFDTVLKMYREATLHEEKDRIASALGAIKCCDVLKEVLFFPHNSPYLVTRTFFGIAGTGLCNVVGCQVAGHGLCDIFGSFKSCGP